MSSVTTKTKLLLENLFNLSTFTWIILVVLLVVVQFLVQKAFLVKKAFPLFVSVMFLHVRHDFIIPGSDIAINKADMQTTLSRCPK